MEKGSRPCARPGERGRAVGHRPSARLPCGWRTPRSLVTRCSRTSSDEGAVPVFSTWPMLEWSRFGMSSGSSTCCPAAAKTTGRAPAGGDGHARATNRASTSPVTGDGTGGRSRFLCELWQRHYRWFQRIAWRPVAASRQRLRAGPRSFPSRRPPTEVLSAGSTRTRLIADAGCAPAVVSRINFSRSRADNVTGRSISEAMTTVFVRQGKGPAGQQPPSRRDHNLAVTLQGLWFYPGFYDVNPRHVAVFGDFAIVTLSSCRLQCLLTYRHRGRVDRLTRRSA